MQAPDCKWHSEPVFLKLGSAESYEKYGIDDIHISTVQMLICSTIKTSVLLF